MSFDHGRFVWFECFTSDVESAGAFYSELLGWRVQSIANPNGPDYSLIKLGGTGIGGFVPLASRGERPFWMSYLSVADVDTTARRVVASGGVQTRDAFDVSEVGRIAVVRDPQGATFALYKAETSDPEEADGPGSWWWNELWASDALAALSFYKSVFGYSHDEMTTADHGDYYVLMQGDVPRAGLMQSPDAEVRPRWLPYVRVEDCDRTAERAKGMGGSVLWPPADIPNVGRATVLADPANAVLAAITPVN